jgi:hypothetical protein
MLAKPAMIQHRSTRYVPNRQNHNNNHIQQERDTEIAFDRQ